MVTLASASAPDRAPDGASDFERVGGEAGLRAIMVEFVDRVFADLMIGFLFARVSRERLIDLEVGYAAEHLGGPSMYGGRPLAEAHRRHPISRGHFGRRTTILRETLARHGVPDDVQARWLAHVESQVGAILRAGHDDACGPGAHG